MHEDIAERILFDQDGIVAVDKPAGLPTSGKSLNDMYCLQYGLMVALRREVWAVHQLDADTTGVNLFTRRRSLVHPVHEGMKPPLGRKIYVALVHGTPAWSTLRIDAPIGPLPRRTDHRLGVTPGGRDARTVAHVLTRGAAFSWVACELFTGRTHQIRIHLASRGHPLVGDRIYAGDAPCPLHPRHALHARGIRLTLPDGTAHRFVAPLPDDLMTFSTSNGLDVPDMALPDALLDSISADSSE